MATPEENLASSLERAAKAKSAGNLESAARWEASADRYRRIIEIKERVEESRKNVVAIKQRIEDSKKASAAAAAAAVATGATPTATAANGSSSGTSVWIIPPQGSTTLPNASATTTTTISSTPSNVSPATQEPPKEPVKTAPIDTVLFDDDSLPIEIMTDLVFENLGGQELINIARNDTVNGQKIIYQPIRNLFNIQQEYNSNNIVSIEGTSNKYFQNFPINFESKVPEFGSGPNQDHVYIDPYNGSLIIEAINIEEDEQIEIQIVIDGTIYEAEL